MADGPGRLARRTGPVRWSGVMLPDTPQEKKHGRDVQRDLFSLAGPDEARLPRTPGEVESQRIRKPNGERTTPRRLPSDQPLLPFGRPSPPRAPAGDGARSQASPPPATTPARSDSARLPALPPGPSASGEVGKARELLQAIRILKQVEADGRPPDDAERQALARFSGFGAVALSLFPDPVTGEYKGPT